MTIHPALGAFETAQEQDRVFDLVQKHLVPALQAHCLRIPSIHTYLINACLNKLGVPTQTAGSVWITKEHATGGFSFDAFIFGVAFPGGHVINHRGERGWEQPQSEQLDQLTQRGKSFGPQCHWKRLPNHDVISLLNKEVRVPRKFLLDQVVGEVVSAIEQAHLQESTQSNTPHKSGGPRL